MADMTSDLVAVGEHNWGGEQRDRTSEEERLRAEFERHGMLTEGDGTLVVESGDGTRIGTVSWRTERWGPSLASRCPAFGIALLPQFRGRGLGTAAQRRLIDYLFETTGAHRIQSDTAVDNPAEQASLRKAGMTVEGIVRDAEYRDQAFHDHTLFSILRPEWEERRQRDPGPRSRVPKVTSMDSGTRNSVIGIAVATLIGALVALAGSDGSTTIGWLAVFALCAVLAYAINWAVFIPSNQRKTEHSFDLTGSATYLAVTVVALLLSDDLDARAVIAAAMVAVWALRLGSFLFRRVRRDGRDGRFDEIKVDPLRFFMTWTLQGLWVLLTVAAALAIITSLERKPIGWVGISGIVVWIAGFAIEVVADRQKSTFKQDAANDGRFITTGLWAWSRHPNYFGEIVLWIGMAIMAVPILSGWRWVVLISPIFVILLLTRVSGIPMLETRAEKRWGDDEDFQAYTRATSVLVPCPPRPTNDT